MAKAPKLKVFTTPIGFHDALVAAPSRAAALRAWGSDHDLFARGAAFEVTDPDLMKEPLATPGEVVRRLRGSEAEQFAALPRDRPSAGKARSAKASAGKATPKRPEPSASELERAEVSLQAAMKRHRDADAEAKARVEAAQRDRADLQRQQRSEEERLREARDQAQAAYDHAIERWRAA
ncbi:hypothetical protein GCM10022268_27790 [Sphingomonas cynarae]|uniref:Cell envelope biogenesis protein TolA n=1 Tax=Sphingomonas cynarae TaxID=930197 RepID=A0ABP7EDU8_9SPHN